MVGVTAAPAVPAECPNAGGPIAEAIVFGEGNTLMAIEPAGGEARKLFEVAPSLWAHEPAWSPDGTTLAFTLSGPTTDPSLPGLQVGAVCALDRQTGTGRVLLRGSVATESVEEPAWAADGQALFVTVRQTRLDADRRYAGDTLTVARYDPATETVTPVVEEAMSPAPAPDGRQLAYIRLDAATMAPTLMLAEVDGEAGRPIAGTEPRFTIVATPRWSPEGFQLLFVADAGAREKASRSGPATLLERLVGIEVAEAHGIPTDLWAINRDGADLRNLTQKGIDDPLGAWSPDGRRLVYSASGTGGIYLLDWEQGTERRLTDQGDYGGISWRAR